MNKQLIIVSIALFVITMIIPSSSEGQVQEVWRWNDSTVWQNNQRAIDDSGNILLAQLQVISAGVMNYKVTKISSNGTMSWNTIWDYNNTGLILALNSDFQGALYSVGSGHFDIGNTGVDTVVYCKHSPDGSYLWSMREANADSTGFMAGTVTSNGTMFAGLIKQRVVRPPEYNCIKSNELGSCNWYNASGSVRSEYVSPNSGINILSNHLWGKHADDSGFVYLENWVSNDTCFNWTTCDRDCNTFDDSLYLVKLTSTGTVIYRKGGLNEHTAYAVTSSGNIYMTKPSGILAKYDQQGALIWTGSIPANTWWHEIMIDPSENSVKVFSYVDDFSSYYISSFVSDGTPQWQITGPTANYASTKKCLDYEGNLYLSNAPWKTIDRINSVTGNNDWTYSADTSPIYQIKTIAGGDLIVIRRDHIQRLTLTTSFTLLDANLDTLSNIDFDLIRVSNNPPFYTEDTLGTVSTDINGQIDLTHIGVDSFTVDITGGLIDTVVVGDSLKFSKWLESELSVKHPVVLPTMYSITLDNGKFDELGVLSYDELSGSSQDIILDHSEFRYNLLVSVEWDAEMDYLTSLQESFRDMSNYLYDVTDGQVRLDTVMTYDDGDHWLEADMQIFASNMEWPRAYANGIQDNLPGISVLFPRKWFGSDNRNKCYNNYPYVMTEDDNFRTYAHELGHYTFGFYDEYLFSDGNGNIVQDDQFRCGDHYYAGDGYGYMDEQYASGGAPSSEMSSSPDYTVGNCQNSNQFVMNASSCWDWLEGNLEGYYGPDNMLVLITKPDEPARTLPAGLDYLPGPNNDIFNLDYDIGGRVVFPVAPAGPAAFTLDVVTHNSMMQRLGNVDVVLRKPIAGGSWRDIPQGKSSDASLDSTYGGGIYVLGAEIGDQIQASANYTTMGIAFRTRGLASTVSSNWLIGSGTVGVSGKSSLGNDYSSASANSLSLNLRAIEGDWPLVCDVSMTDSNATLILTSERTFSTVPTVQVGSQSYDFTPTVGGYQVTIDSSLNSVDHVTVWAQDDSSATFFFRTPFMRSTIDSSSSGRWLLGANGRCELFLDSSASANLSGMILSSPYPVIRTGLAPEAVQAGESHAFAVSVPGSLSGTHSIIIRYDNGDLNVGDSSVGVESDLIIYKWIDNLAGWKLLGGTVDTIDNTIMTSITETGVYAAFTTQMATDVDEEHGGNLPYDFKLSQNYPNPFNPVTTFEYSLPRRSHVTIEVLNVLGQRINSIVDRDQSAGSYTITWDGTNSAGTAVATGVYLYRFQAGDHVETKKMLLLK